MWRWEGVRKYKMRQGRNERRLGQPPWVRASRFFACAAACVSFTCIAGGVERQDACCLFSMRDKQKGWLSAMRSHTCFSAHPLRFSLSGSGAGETEARRPRGCCAPACVPEGAPPCPCWVAGRCCCCCCCCWAICCAICSICCCCCAPPLCCCCCCCRAICCNCASAFCWPWPPADPPAAVDVCVCFR